MQRSFCVRRFLFAAFLGLAVTLGACGGGGSGGNGFFPGGIPSGGDPSGGGDVPPPTEGEAASVARLNAMDRLADQFEAITGGRKNATPEQWEALRAWTVAQAEFDDAGVGDASLWARFKDGRYYLFSDNWRVPKNQPEPEPAPDEEDVERTGLRSAGALAATPVPSIVRAMPGSTKAVLLVHSGAPAPNPNEFRFGEPLVRSMKKALTERGYSVTRQAMTVANVKAVGDVGFLYFNSHSAMYGPGAQKEFAVMLDDFATVVNDVVHREDLEEGNLIYHRERTIWQAMGKGNPPKLSFTDKFVRRYLKFAPNALVITYSCNSGNAESANFRSALKASGAGSIVGWDGSSNPNGYPAIGLLVDRMAGVNQYEPVAVPNRSFVFKDVMAYLQKRGLMSAPGVEDDDGHITPDAFIRVDGDLFTKLAPVITHLEMKAGNLLVAHGDFGNEPGTVTVGGVPVNATWAPTQIKAVLGNATHGAVVVTAKELRSNPRQLGSWQGRVSYQSKRVDKSCAGATFLADVNVDLHLRADMQARREEVDGPLKNNNLVIVPADDTQGQWAASGRCVQGDEVVLAHSGSGALAMRPFVDFDVLKPFSDAVYARLDAVQKRLHIAGTFGKSKMTLQDRDRVTQSELQVWLQLSDYFYDGSPNWPHDERFPYASYIALSPKLDAAAGVTDRQEPSNNGMSLKFQWGAMQVSPAFDDKVGN
jgi:hypothetical protein